MILGAMAAVVIGKSKKKGSEIGISNHLDHTATTSSSPTPIKPNANHYMLCI
jgi:hypothetical protein